MFSKMLFLFTAFFSTFAFAVTLEAAKGKTGFLAVGRPSAIKIKGEGQGPSGDLQFSKIDGKVSVNGEARVDLSTLDSGIGMRDHHMKEKYLEVDKFKDAILKFSEAPMPAEVLRNGGEVLLPAILSLHGQEKPVTVAMTIKKNGDKISAASRFKVKLSEYSIAIPSFSGITVADEVEISTDTEVPSAALKDVL
ncbi:MAG: YceI family protein [Bdellovibrionales bacterium]